jgi:hypothetical protein
VITVRSRKCFESCWVALQGNIVWIGLTNQKLSGYFDRGTLENESPPYELVQFWLSYLFCYDLRLALIVLSGPYAANTLVTNFRQLARHYDVKHIYLRRIERTFY